MGHDYQQTIKAGGRLLSAAIASVLLMTGIAHAEKHSIQPSAEGVVIVENPPQDVVIDPNFREFGAEFQATIWIDPDGCEHWVMDDGFEGYMTPHRTRDGRPVCHRSEICGVMPADQFFVLDEHWITKAGKQRLMDFFQETSPNTFGYLIYGHTDARASDEYNMRLSNRRANMVADVARDAGVRVIDVKGFGERQPRVNGRSEAAYKQNRRVEIYCAR